MDTSRLRFITRRLMTLCLLLVFLTSSATAATPVRRTWTIEGVTREALVAVPPTATTISAPVVFAFHYHGHSMQGASTLYKYHTLWPQAIVVYMQGLKTPGQFIDPKGNLSGWQRFKGDQGDRDLKFFDAVMASIRKDYKIDASRIYSAGHSNGGNFTYLLWAERGDLFAAMAPSAGVATGFTHKLVPKPVLHVAGTNDGIVSYAAQNATIEAVKIINQSSSGTPWEKICTWFSSPSNNPVITMLTKIGHAFPSQAPALIVKFFQGQSKPVVPVSSKVTWITASGSTSARQRELTWNPVSGAVRYDVWLNDVTNHAGQVIREQGLTSTSFTPAAELNMGMYQAWVRGIDALGNPGPWSDKLEMSVILVPQPISPLGANAETRPVFQWSGVPGATDYEIWISRGTNTTAALVREGGLTHATYTPTTDLPADNYRWWIRARSIGIGSSIIGPWTPAQSFFVASTP